MFNIFKYIIERRNAKKAIKRRLHYIEIMKPLGNKATDECTVTREK